MKLGTENKKSVYALAVLGVIAAVAVYSSFFSDSNPTPAPKSAAVTDPQRAAAEIPGSPAPIPSPAPTPHPPPPPHKLPAPRRSRADDVPPPLPSNPTQHHS